MEKMDMSMAIELPDDFAVNRYLTYAQIQQIVNAVEKAAQTDDGWATRETNIDMLVLYHATNLGKEKLEEIGHETLLQSSCPKE